MSPGLDKFIGGARYPAYNDGIVTNHRGIFLDLNCNSLFGARQELAERQERLLNTKDKKGAAKYQSAASEKIQSNHIYQHLVEIDRHAQDDFTPQLK